MIRNIARLIARGLALWIIVPVFHVIESFVKFRLTPIVTMRIGGLAVINHFFAAEREIYGPERGVRRLFFGAVPCNRQLFEMWKQVMPTWESRSFSAFYQYTSDILERVPTFRPLPNDKGAGFRTNTNFLISRSGAVLNFDKRDEAKGRALLESMGIGADDWFICFHARDSKYQSELEDHGDTKIFRNAPLKSYLPAAEYITKKGGFAIRVGQLVEDPLPDLENPRIIDYSTHFHSDFGDIFLPGTCRFFLASASGYQQVPVLFGRPVAAAHLLPLVPNQIGAQSLYTPKLFINRQNGEYLTYDECFSSMGDPKNYGILPF
jgi:putative glycosyltransferase (TIGR04372 family)